MVKKSRNDGPEWKNWSLKRIIIVGILGLVMANIGGFASTLRENNYGNSKKDLDNSIRQELNANKPSFENLTGSYNPQTEKFIQPIKNTGTKPISFGGTGDIVVPVISVTNNGNNIPYEIDKKVINPGEEAQLAISLEGKTGSITTSLDCKGVLELNKDTLCIPGGTNHNNSFEIPNYTGIRILGVDATFQNSEKSNKGEKYDEITLDIARKFFETKGSIFFTAQSAGVRKGLGAVTVGTKNLFPNKKPLFIFFNDEKNFSEEFRNTLKFDIGSLFTHLDSAEIFSYTDLQNSLDIQAQTNKIKTLLYFVGDCSTQEFGFCDINLDKENYKLFSKKMLEKNNIDVFFIIPTTLDKIKIKE